MIASFPLLQQPPGSNSCLPTAVRAVLLWQGEQVSSAEVSEWCNETPKGCWIDEALEGLRMEGFDVEELTQNAEDALRATVTDEDVPYPVIVTIRDAAVQSLMDHAVVVVGIRHSEDQQGETVEFMDPLTGKIEADATGAFWLRWDIAGNRAFVIRP